MSDSTDTVQVACGNGDVAETNTSKIFRLFTQWERDNQEVEGLKASIESVQGRQKTALLELVSLLPPGIKTITHRGKQYTIAAGKERVFVKQPRDKATLDIG